MIDTSAIWMSPISTVHVSVDWVPVLAMENAKILGPFYGEHRETKGNQETTRR